MKDVYFFIRDTRLFAMSATENIAHHLETF